MSRSGAEIADEIMASHEQMKRDTILSFLQKVRKGCEKNICDTCPNPIFLICSKKSINWTDENITTFIEKVLEGE